MPPAPLRVTPQGAMPVAGQSLFHGILGGSHMLRL